MWRKWLYRFQETIGLTEKECQACLLISLLLIIGAAVRTIPSANSLFDEAYYADFQTEFSRLAARADSFDNQQIMDTRDEEASESQPELFEPVDLNSATRAQLETVPRIGPKIAQRILILRRQLGRFQDVSDLLMIEGIGEKTLEVMRKTLTVSTADNEMVPMTHDTR